ncbi:hypothetical protein FPZ49_15420 [Paenibacillus cremeus]|uniref:Uncharacterized protein n=1 Tax=Paenibacillus cremeus TaxID=2163881 RepID=A0A559KAD6_9BACL|nr:hypothetical protein FPZ49_15420 [Paenibacillus cremeus]
MNKILFLRNIVEIWGMDREPDGTIRITAIVDTDLEANCTVSDVEFDYSSGRLPKIISIFIYTNKRVRIFGLKFRSRSQREAFRDQILNHSKLRLRLLLV